MSDTQTVVEGPQPVNKVRGNYTEPGDKPIILRPDDRPKKHSTRLLKAECPECGYTIRLTKRWADAGLANRPTDRAALALDGGGASESEGVHVLAPAAVRLT